MLHKSRILNYELDCADNASNFYFGNMTRLPNAAYNNKILDCAWRKLYMEEEDRSEIPISLEIMFQSPFYQPL